MIHCSDVAASKNEVKLPKPILELPKPDFDPGSNDTMREKSVFINRFVEEDNAKKAILEKHVKMVSTDVKTVNGKKICWNYRKNKCRFGHNCKYAHDSDLQTDPSTIATNETNVKQIDASKVSSLIEDENQMVKGKKRPGLSQNLVPSKKVIKNYNQQKWKTSK